MNNNKIYSIGQRINVIDTKQANSGSAGKITDAYIGADGMMHFRSRNKQPLKPGSLIQGYSVEGLADFIWLYLRNYTPINEDTLRAYDVGPECVKEAIMDALEELGF